jgi:hypothetical protein
MATKDMPASKNVINSILHPHADLAVNLMNMMGSRSTGNAACRIQSIYTKTATSFPRYLIR